ncbi:PKD repeat protein [Pedobacter cryoconitis]|uniref:PKD domain-containing protein n=1 Tax=Pedobacter cryoconitis TaxID=188932 RepID=UPI001610C5C2|nr:PKD domain-containing protein [Pedobacter cryoconitis]MBB6274362.1 PKD repeat protein [Pedobacter cryoconitis]
MKNIKTLSFILFLIGAVCSACKKDKSEKLTDLSYTIDVNGNQVKFTPVTAGISSYRWDFGDGQTSTDANPVHIYPGKGKYVPTLYATVNGQSAEASTVIRIAKGSPVKLNDNTLDDWNTVTTNVITSGIKGGIFRKVKYDYDGNYIYIYVEMASKKTNGDIFDFYIDADNSSATGFLGGFSGGGYDILMEGPMLTANMDVFYHNGSQTSFSFQQQSITEAYQIGTVIEEAGLLKFEMQLARGKLKGLTGTGARLGIIATKSDWSASLGYAPDEGQPGFLLDMSE